MPEEKWFDLCKKRWTWIEDVLKNFPHYKPEDIADVANKFKKENTFEIEDSFKASREQFLSKIRSFTP